MTITISPYRDSRQVTGDDRRHSDADAIRQQYGIKRFDPANFDYYRVVPNMINHTWDPDPGELKGGTDLFMVGPPGSGKSTLALRLAVAMMGHNDEPVVWRGSPSRSEWLPFAPWATLVLPSDIEIEAVYEPHSRDQERAKLEIDEIARDVNYYDDVEDVIGGFEPGKFYVLYPDPKMRGLQRVYEETPSKTYDGLEFQVDDPLPHWWFGWLLARIERGPQTFLTWIADEVGDIVPQDARADDRAHYQKVELYQDCFVDARKQGLSIINGGHSEPDVHDKLRRKIRWRATMPTGANPTRESQVVGFGSVPMDWEIMSRRDLGEVLVWTESNFELIKYPPIESEIDGSIAIKLRGGCR